MAKLLRRVLLYPLLFLAGCHTLITGSPIPLWHVEELEHPQNVVRVSDTALVLANGAHVELPYIRELPTDNSLFHEALKYGVDVRPDGEVIGLLRVQKVCGNDPVVYRKLRVNLSDLAGVLNPGGIDSDVVAPDAIEFLEEIFSDVTESERVDAYLFSKMRMVREQFGGESTSTQKPIGGAGQHDRRTGSLVL